MRPVIQNCLKIHGLENIFNITTLIDASVREEMILYIIHDDIIYHLERVLPSEPRTCSTHPGIEMRSRHYHIRSAYPRMRMLIP